MTTYCRSVVAACAASTPSVSRSTPNRQLWLVFAVSLGVEITEFRVGDALIEEYSPPVKADTRQR